MAAPEILPARPVSVLIAALGGEGGGVLTNWLVAAAERENFVVQSISIPGLAQRTGATTYFVEIYPAPLDILGERRPVMTLLPNPGAIDIMATSEIVEAGRAMQNGFVTPDCTTLVASTHRVYSTLEKSALADGRYDAGRITSAAGEMALDSVLFDMSAAAAVSGSVINTVLLGAIAGTGRLPMSRETLEEVIRDSGIAVEANLRGLATGWEQATLGTPKPEVAEPTSNHRAYSLTAGTLAERVEREHPDAAQSIVDEAVGRLIDFQDLAYAGLYLDRLDMVRELETEKDGGSLELTLETARGLARWMAFEDIVRVAELKTRPERFEQIRRDLGAAEGEPLIVLDYLKPGWREAASLMPGFIARPMMRRAEKLDRLGITGKGLRIRGNGALGFAMLRLMTKFKRWRRWGYRYKHEQALIERWLSALRSTAERDEKAALEIAMSARLIKGYGETRQRGEANLIKILENLIEPALEASMPDTAERISEAREAALAGAESLSLATALGLGPAETKTAAE